MRSTQSGADKCTNNTWISNIPVSKARDCRIMRYEIKQASIRDIPLEVSCPHGVDPSPASYNENGIKDARVSL